MRHRGRPCTVYLRPQAVVAAVAAAAENATVHRPTGWKLPPGSRTTQWWCAVAVGEMNWRCGCQLPAPVVFRTYSFVYQNAVSQADVHRCRLQRPEYRVLPPVCGTRSGHDDRFRLSYLIERVPDLPADEVMDGKEFSSGVAFATL